VVNQDLVGTAFDTGAHRPAFYRVHLRGAAQTLTARDRGRPRIATLSVGDQPQAAAVDSIGHPCVANAGSSTVSLIAGALLHPRPIPAAAL